MSKEAVFTMKLEPELRDEFMAEAQALDRPASQVMRDLMRGFVHRQREIREYDALVRRNKGIITVDSALGRGTRMTVSFALAENPALTDETPVVPGRARVDLGRIER